MNATPRIPFWPVVLRTTLSFLALAPLCTFGLLLFKGLPSFAEGHLFEVILWAYQIGGIPALASGLMLSAVLLGIRPWIGWFIHPYDFGRSVSLGAIVGGMAEAFSTFIVRALSHRPYSSFWMAGAALSGVLAGACITAFFLARDSKQRAHSARS